MQVIWHIRDEASAEVTRLAQRNPRRAQRWIRFNPTAIKLLTGIPRERPEEIIRASAEYISAARAAEYASALALLTAIDEGPHP